MVLEVTGDLSDVEVVAGVDSLEESCGVYRSLGEVRENFDVVLDFSVASAIEDVVSFVRVSGKPLVVAVTGHNAEQIGLLGELAKEVAVFKSVNFSLVMNKFIRSVVEFSQCWDGDIEIIEAHHGNKVDAPSGTALVIAQKILAVRGYGKIVVGRSHGKRADGDVGISSVRGGSVKGEHEVRFFCDRGEVIMKQVEYGRESFAFGAIEACKFICNKKPCFYTMEELVENNK